MIAESRETFSLNAANPETALAFLHDPARALSKVRFLRELHVSGPEVRGVLTVALPMLGEVTLPFFSVLETNPQGAVLRPQPLDGERAWLEVAGEGTLSGHQLTYLFVFRAHLDTPTAEKWGSAAFEKMVQAAATRTMARVSRELPQAVAAALAAGDG